MFSAEESDFTFMYHISRTQPSDYEYLGVANGNVTICLLGSLAALV